jgi:hypothetical protein
MLRRLLMQQRHLEHLPRRHLALLRPSVCLALLALVVVFRVDIGAQSIRQKAEELTRDLVRLGLDSSLTRRSKTI